MIVTVFTRVIPPRDTAGFTSSGFDLPRFHLSNEDGMPGGNGFTTCEQAATIAADVALYGRTVGTIANILIIDSAPPGLIFQRYYRVNDGGTLQSVPSSELDESGIPLALYA
jgi:hypothetical protein